MNISAATEGGDLLADDPTIDNSSNPNDEANGETPEPFVRYGQTLPKEWIPLYRKPMRTPTRKLRVVAIGAGVDLVGGSI